MINALRCHHCNTPPLVWNAALASDAAAYVATCPTTGASGAQLSGAAESISWTSLPYTFLEENDANWLDVIQHKWYYQEHWYYYPGGFGVQSVNINDFAQLMYDTTTSVGCAYNRECSNVGAPGAPNNVVSCRFYPPALQTSAGRLAHVHNTVSRGYCASGHAQCSSAALWAIPAGTHDHHRA